MISRVISNKPRILSPHSSSKPPRFRDLRTLQLSLRSFFASRRLFSATCGLFLPNTRGGGTPTLPRRASLPPSYAPRGAFIPCGLNRLRILPVTTRVYPFLATRLPRASRGYFPKSFRMRRSKIASPEVLWNEQIQKIPGGGGRIRATRRSRPWMARQENGLESFCGQPLAWESGGGAGGERDSRRDSGARAGARGCGHRGVADSVSRSADGSKRH